MITVSEEIAAGQCTRRFGGFQLQRVYNDGRFLEELIAAAMIGMEMRTNNDINIVRTKSTRNRKKTASKL